MITVGWSAFTLVGSAPHSALPNEPPWRRLRRTLFRSAKKGVSRSLTRERSVASLLACDGLFSLRSLFEHVILRALHSFKGGSTWTAS